MKYKNPTHGTSERAAFSRTRPIGEIPQRYPLTDHRRIFLDTDNLRVWDGGIYQRFPQAEKVALTGLEPGPAGSCDSRQTEITGSVLIEDGKFRMWYIAMPDAEGYDESIDHYFTAYAESEDGIHWRKPDLGITAQHRYPGSNLIPLPGHVFGVVPALAGASYKYLAATVQINEFEPDITDQKEWGFEFNGTGTYLWTSDDGLRWRQLTRIPLIINGDIGCLVADPATKRYLLYHKVGMIHGLDTRRAFIGLESTDGIHWEGYNGVMTHRECFVADDYDDLIAARVGLRIANHYGVAVGRVGDLYVATESMLLLGDPIQPYFGQSWNGPAQIRLAYSHNGMNWRHPRGRPPFIEIGEPGQFDGGFMVTSNTFVNHGDDTLLYAYGAPHPHGWCVNKDCTIRKDIPLTDHLNAGQIFLARIKRDRFASLAAPYKGCFDVQNTTCLERTSGRWQLDAGPRGGDQLFVNARCPQGRIRAAILEQHKTTPLPGYSLDDCIPFSGDAVRAPIRFRNTSLASIPPEMGLFLRFEVKHGEIFGYDWGDA